MLVYQALADARRLARVIEPFDPLPFLHMAEALGRAAAAQSELARGARPDQTWRELKRELYPLSRLFRSAGFDRIVRRLAAARKDAFASYSMPIALMLWDLFDSVITTREALAHLAEAIDLETSNNQNA